ncbi:murein transglycosylase A [Sulfurimonas sp. MAG313]|nr:murein transglycosylase A [Sulfurimonas sp. MAG313]MDF1881350.1 murein transglycosylase A [Sulfurimonas sp. MAG313]
MQSISYGSYNKVSFAQLPAWENQDFENSLELFKKTCAKLTGQKLFEIVCRNALESKNAHMFFEDNFTPFKALAKTSLATGYYEPSLKGSLVQSTMYPYPVYGVPSQMLRIKLLKNYEINKPLRGRLYENKVIPFYSRKEINAGALKEPPLCYVNNKIDLFFLHVQGSGIVELDEGGFIYLGYADQNGHPYFSIGKEMITKGYLIKEEVSLQSIKSYLQQHPDIRDEILNTNPSYIFFEKRTQPATGSLGLVLEAGFSVAVDRKNIPLGLPLYIKTKEPLQNQDIQKIVFAHDTGGAIKGESRIDIFFGSSAKAKEQAGQMKAHLVLWILIPNDYLNKSK